MWSLKLSNREFELPQEREATWYNLDRSVCAYVYSINGLKCLDFPHIALYLLDNNSYEITAIPTKSADTTLVEDTFRRLVLPMQMQLAGMEVLHASAVLMNAGVIALCANSGTGKSTTAFALSRRGYRVFADDVVPFELRPSETRANSLPFRVRLRADAANYLDHQYAHRYSKNSHAERLHQIDHATAPLRLIIILRRSLVSMDLRDTEVRQMKPQESFLAILRHAWCFSLIDEDRKALMIKQYLDLVSRIPVYEISFKADLTKINSLLDTIEEIYNTTGETAIQDLSTNKQVETTD
jgi:hypothetical protein